MLRGASPSQVTRAVGLARPVRILLVEDNAVFREALELLFSLRDDIDVVASVGDGSAAVPACVEHQPDVVLMDYRLPGLDGVQATRAVRAACPNDGGRLPHGVRRRPRDRRAAGGRRDRVPAQGPGAGGDRRRDQARRREPRVNLTAANTAIVLDSTADFPDARAALPELARRAAVRQLRHRELPRRRRADRGRVLRASAVLPPTLPTTSQPTPADFKAVYDELVGYDRIFSIHIAATLSGTFAEREARGRTTACARSTRRPRRRRSRCSRSRSSGGSSAGTTDEEIDALVERYKRRATRCSSPSTRSSSSRAAAASAARGRSPASCCTSSRS